MPKRLYLLRHAKAAPEDASTPDHDRPLTPSGAEDAARIGRYFADRHDAPDMILCSTALRAAQTLGLVVKAFKHQPPVEYQRGLYLCGVDIFSRRLHEIETAVGSVMIVAHNPDLHELALSLAADGAPADVAMLRRTFPPGALATLTLEIEAWSGVRPGSARLDEFTTPIDLA